MSDVDELAMALGVSVDAIEKNMDLVRLLSKKRNAVKVSELKLEGSFDCDAVRTAFEEWLKYKRLRGQPYRCAMGLNKILNQFRPLGPKALIDQINYSISTNYAGVIPPRHAIKQASDWHEQAGKCVSEMTTAERHKWNIPYKSGS